MADPTINDGAVNLDFIILNGELGGLRESLAEITRHGVDGHEYQKLGTRAPTTMLLGERDKDSAANAKTLQTAYEDMVSEIVTITDSHGQAWTNFVVRDVQVTIRKCGVSAGGIEGATPTHMVYSTWVVQYAGT